MTAPNEESVDDPATILGTLLERLPGMENGDLTTFAASLLQRRLQAGPDLSPADFEVAAVVGQLCQNELLRRLLVRTDRVGE